MTLAYVATASPTKAFASLATSSTLTVGWSTASFTNSSNLATDIFIAGQIMVGTTPTANTVIEVWLIPALNDTPAWPDTFDGTSKGVTITNRANLLNYAFLLVSMDVPAATSNVAYPFARSVRSATGLVFPPKTMQGFVVHNTGVNLNSTEGNHLFSVNPMQT